MVCDKAGLNMAVNTVSHGRVIANADVTGIAAIREPEPIVALMADRACAAGENHGMTSRTVSR
jgi:hypothetical protein